MQQAVCAADMQSDLCSLLLAELSILKAPRALCEMLQGEVRS